MHFTYVLQAMADQWSPEGRVLSGQRSDSGERAALAFDDRSPRAGEQMDKKHGKGQRPRSYQVKGRRALISETEIHYNSCSSGTPIPTTS